ncbi:MAG: acyltransferase [candidate division KSB1 bacterium]|nr:acyltransferase [candidate division KSB1 bacterium]
MISKIAYFLAGCLAGPAFRDSQFPAGKLLKQAVLQKIRRKNAHVPWPVHPSSVVKSPERIQRGSRCPGLSPFCYLDGRNGIMIGENTWIGPRVSVISMNHNLCDYREYIKAEPIRIGRNCWLGAGAIVTAGVTLGDHTIVGAGAVVTHSFPQGDILIAGVPARIVRQLDHYSGEMNDAESS